MSQPPSPSDPPDADESPGEIEKGMRDSPSGDPRVLFVLNAVLSALFAYTVLFLSDYVGITTLTVQRLVAFTLILMLITHIVTDSSR